MSELFQNGSEDETRILLLGYPCAEEIRDSVVSYLQGLSDNDHALVCEWALYGIDRTMITGEDITLDQARRRREGNGNLTEEDALHQIDDRIRWFKFISESETVVMLDEVEPIDGIGEGDVSNLEWVLINGGVSDFAMLKSLEYGIETLERWKKYATGESRIMPLVAGQDGSVMLRGTGVLWHMSRIYELNTPEAIKHRQDKDKEMIESLMNKLVPVVQALLPMLEMLGIDPNEVGVTA